MLRRGATCVVAELGGERIEVRVEEIATAVAAEAGAGAGAGADAGKSAGADAGTGFNRTTAISGTDGDGLAPGIEAMGARRVVSNCSAKTAR